MNNSSIVDRSPWAVFLVFLRLGLTSFGGPIAHLGYFRDEFVVRRQWVTDRAYADLVALCQFLPGPTSSQVGIALGLSRSGYAGALAAWVGFTLPSAIVMVLFALGMTNYGDVIPAGVLHGFKVVAVAVVAQAVWGMARHLCVGTSRVTIMVASACFVLFVPSVWGQAGVMLMAAMIALSMFKIELPNPHDALAIKATRRSGVLWLMAFFVLLIGLPFLALMFPSQLLTLIDAFYRAGSLVFGGGHVVLPLLQAELVPSGWISNDYFLAGYGLAQAVPGPLFTFAAYVGASMNVAPSGWLGGIICLVVIFVPSFLLVLGVLPFWEQLRQNARTQAALSGINAAVVGVLLAALYQPVWTSAVYAPQDFGLVLVALVALMFWKLPPWLVVMGSGVAGGLLI